MTNRDKARVRWRQIFERDEFPLRACSTCLQHCEEQGKRWEQQRERERVFQNVEDLFLWHTKVVGIQGTDLFLSRAINLSCIFHDPEAHRGTLLKNTRCEIIGILLNRHFLYV